MVQEITREYLVEKSIEYADQKDSAYWTNDCEGFIAGAMFVMQLLQQTPCTTQLPPTEDDFLHIAQFVRRMHNDFTDAELWHEYNKDV